MAADYHEPFEGMPEQDRNFHRALISMKEEIEAVDWYHQRVVACQDESLRAILAHNRDEEIEHATMTLEWLRRNMPAWDHALRTYLFTDRPIHQIEEAADDAVPSRPAAGRGLGLGALGGPR